MNISSSFNIIIAQCILDIKSEIHHCQSQLDNTKQKIKELEDIQESTTINAIELGLLVQKMNLLLIDNFCCISKQSKLISYYTVLLNVVNTRSARKPIDAFSNQDSALNELIDYYESKSSLDIVEILKKYSEEKLNLN